MSAKASIWFVGYEHPVDKLVIHLLEAIEDPALALMQWDEVFSVAEVSFSVVKKVPKISEWCQQLNLCRL